MIDETTLAGLRDTMTSVFLDTELELLTEHGEPDELGEVGASAFRVARTVLGTLYEERATFAPIAGAAVQVTDWAVSVPWDTDIAGIVAVRVKGTDKALYVTTDNALDRGRWVLTMRLRETRPELRP